MTAPYTLHLPPEAGDDPDTLDRAVLVRDGFSPLAFVAPALFFFVHRHLWLGLGAVAVVGGLAAGLGAAGAGPGTIVMAEILLHALFGFEAASLRRFALARRGRPAGDLVLAGSEQEASAKAFSRWLEDRRTEWQPAGASFPASATAGTAARRPWGEPVLGLFPEPQNRPGPENRR